MATTGGLARSSLGYLPRSASLDATPKLGRHGWVARSSVVTSPARRPGAKGRGRQRDGWPARARYRTKPRASPPLDAVACLPTALEGASPDSSGWLEDATHDRTEIDRIEVTSDLDDRGAVDAYNSTRPRLCGATHPCRAQVDQQDVAGRGRLRRGGARNEVYIAAPHGHDDGRPYLAAGAIRIWNLRKDDYARLQGPQGHLVDSHDGMGTPRRAEGGGVTGTVASNSDVPRPRCAVDVVRVEEVL